MEIQEWVLLYEPFSIVAIVYTLLAWGTVFLLDPSSKVRQREQLAEQKFHDAVSKKELEFLDSIEGRQAIADAATAKVKAKYQKDYDEQPKHFNGSPVAVYQAETPSLKDVSKVNPQRGQE